MTASDRRNSRPNTIDRTSFEPAYSQLANILKAQIAAGAFRPGDQLPSEGQLCRTYGVSPMTVRRSINLLADQDVVATAQGRGTFVKRLQLGTAAFDLGELQNLFSDERTTSVRLLDARIVAAHERAANKLAVSVGDNVIYIRRLITTDERPAFYHREYLIYDPRRPIVESEMEITSLSGLFSGSGSAIVKRADLAINATLMNEEEANLLQTQLPAAAFLLEHIFYDFEDRPLSWGWFIANSERLRFTTTVGIQD
ncbi:MAG: GntR family transcriptional regulator [Chloroflexi bacterium]|nr:GntR family transcriptional regulator [Chloroflexota bacterium]